VPEVCDIGRAHDWIKSGGRRRDSHIYRGGEEVVIASLKPLFAAMGKVFFRMEKPARDRPPSSR